MRWCEGYEEFDDACYAGEKLLIIINLVLLSTRCGSIRQMTDTLALSHPQSLTSSSQPGTVPVKLQISAYYKVACMIRSGTHKRIPYDRDIWITLLFMKDEGRTEIAECDGPNWSKDDTMISLLCQQAGFASRVSK